MSDNDGANVVELGAATVVDLLARQVERHAAIITELIAEHGAALARSAEIAAERKEIAFRAHTGDEVARARLGCLNDGHNANRNEVETLEVALEEAKSRLTATREAVATESLRGQAREALSRVAEFRKRGARLDKLARQLVADFVEFEADVLALQHLGVTHPSSQMVRVASKRSLQAHLVGSGLQIEPLPPTQRHSFAELTEAWARGIEAWAAARLGDKKAA